MADLDVQLKKKKSFLPWLLLILGIVALVFFLMHGRDNDKVNQAGTDSVTAVTTPANDTSSDIKGAWESVDFNAPAVTYDEITDKNINVRGNNEYGIYGLGENVLFDQGKNTIRADAAQNLKQIATSIQKRYNGASVRVFGYTDSVGSINYNKELAAQRAEAVRNWLSANGNIAADKISVETMGETRPVATNATAEGRQQNRRVEIVARSGSK